jgi:DNA-directed RNA polymerase specialized sigma24 family protein
MQAKVYAEAFETGFGATRRFLISRGLDAEEAEEIAQDAWVRGWEHRSQLREPRLVSFWVNAIARNLFRAKFRAPLRVPIGENQDPVYTMSLDLIELNRLLESCSTRDREMLEQILEGYSAEEISKTSGISSTGVRVRMLRARQALRRKFSN